MTLDEQEKQACIAIDEVREELLTVAMELHSHPELGLNEEYAVKTIKKFLNTHQFQTTIGVSNIRELNTAMQSDYVENGSYNATNLQKMAFLGEYDALPGLVHGCGHNLIAIMSLGGAYGFSHSAGSNWMTTFFCCPAEETIGGKVYMADAGLFNGYEAALIIHPGGENEIGGTSLATHPLEVTYHGQSAHIASLTDSGINALDCVVDLYEAIKELKKTFPKGAIIGAIVTDGGTAPNVVTTTETLRMTVRGATVDDLENIILPAIKTKAREIADEYGATVDMHHYEPLFKDMKQDERLLHIFSDVMTEFGESPRHLPPDEADGSTDVGNVSYEVPTAQPTLSIGLGLESHTPEFTCAADSMYGLEQAIKGAKNMAVTALRFVDGL